MITSGDKMEDLYYLLKDQVNFLPIEKNTYFYDFKTEKLFRRHYSKIREITGVVNKKNKDNPNIWIINSNNKLRVSKFRLLCFLQNGLLPEMISILDNRYTVNKDGNKYKWLTISDSKLLFNKKRLERVYEEHPDLYIKEGFYDEGVIPYKYRPGFIIVPTTNGTLAINSNTEEAVYTYSNELLTPQITKRGDKKFVLNKRLCSGKTMFLYSRALAFISLPIPDKYKTIGNSIINIVNLLDVDHIDGIPSNNSVNNIQYLTRQENLIKKLDQEMDPRVFPNTWKSPNGKIVRFRSFREAANVIKCNIISIEKVYKGWRNINEINGWVILEGKLKHPLEEWYLLIEKHGINRNYLTLFKKDYLVYNIKEKKFYQFKNTTDMYTKFNLNKDILDRHMGVKGPLTPVNGIFLVVPYRYLNILLKIKYFDYLIKEYNK